MPPTMVYMNTWNVECGIQALKWLGLATEVPGEVVPRPAFQEQRFAAKHWYA